ncbi:hypothetical protein EYF80_022012 [Liparis tanakae]|uniref:Uncharacterized protein n=1 Tax=Liparis tanakae TaxID=230148 RepID=A0A4Z2HPB9_9TELE|nr:hypothetical protein EYF80_022012 [Liparis tanakae]
MASLERSHGNKIKERLLLSTPSPVKSSAHELLHLSTRDASRDSFRSAQATDHKEGFFSERLSSRSTPADRFHGRRSKPRETPAPDPEKPSPVGANRSDQ